ncbi:thiamine/thiamine pyrophosphate ABC transporter permease ThiP, partial [Salmonella enterica subsp. enterica serovar Kentucky]
VRIVPALLLLRPPLVAGVVDAVNRSQPQLLAQPILSHAVWTSLRIALPAGVRCLGRTMMLLWSSRELRQRQQLFAGHTLELSG